MIAKIQRIRRRREKSWLQRLEIVDQRANAQISPSHTQVNRVIGAGVRLNFRRMFSIF